MMQDGVLKVKLLCANAQPPMRSTSGAAGYDVFSSQDCVVPASGKALVATGIAVAVPEGCYGRVAPRSGLASKHAIHVGAGVIDADYRGAVSVLLFNLSQDPFVVHAGDRIAQLIIERIALPEVTIVGDLDVTVRGDGGFGSTGGFASEMGPLA